MAYRRCLYDVTCIGGHNDEKYYNIQCLISQQCLFFSLNCIVILNPHIWFHGKAIQEKDMSVSFPVHGVMLIT